MKILLSTLLQVFILSGLLLNSASIFASHSFAGLDMCALYPEVMPPGLLPEQLPDASGTGALLMQNYCAQCHELPGPGRHTAEEWPQVLDRMLLLMDVADRFTGLLGNVKTPTLNEREQLRNYLVLYALKPLLKKPQGTGAAAFESNCSGCHALPDPAQYNLDWSLLIKRMQRNMEVMKYSPPSADNMMLIQHYLQNNHFTKANDVATGAYPGLNISGGSIGFNERKLTAGSWWSLGVFFVLTLIGLLRWWHSHRDSNQLNRHKD